MEPAPASLGQLADASKQFARRLFTIGENRFELLIVEVQEERDRLLHAILLALGVAAFGFLALLTLNIALVILLWDHSPVLVLVVLTGLYTGIAVYLYRRLTGLLQEWQILSATIDQLQKDHECLKKNLS